MKRLRWAFPLLLAASLLLFFSSSTSGLLSLVVAPPSRAEQILRLNTEGVAFMEQLKFQEAAAKFSAILRLLPDFVPAHVNLGIARFNLQQYKEAAASLERALELDPSQIRAHYVLGLIFRNQDQPGRAIAEFEQVAQRDPEDPSTNYFLGLLHSRRKEYRRAIRYLGAVTAREPYNASAHYNLAIALLRSGRRQEGSHEMEAFRRLQGMFGTTTIGLQYLEQGRYSLVMENIPDRYFPEPPPAEAESRVEVHFTEATARAGLAFHHQGGAPGEPSYFGSGAAFADYDGDGRLDLFLANSAPPGAASALFHNRGGGTFEEITATAGLHVRGRTMSGLWGDYDNDGHPDLYLINDGPDQLWHNRGDGTFEEVSAAAGLGDSGWGMSGAWVDYDHDGDLDLFVSGFGKGSEKGAPQGHGNRMYRNNGNGTFTDVSHPSGLEAGEQRTLGVICTDFDNSRDIDFYLVNAGTPNQLFSNLRDGTFRQVASGPVASSSPLGAGVGIGDFNRDGRMDLVLPEGSRVRLLLGESGGHYRASLLEASEPIRYALEALVFDYDNDGDQDILVAAAPLFEKPAGPWRNFYLFENRRGTFRDATRQARLDAFHSLQLRGSSLGDYDGDGDLDIVFNVNGGAPLLLRNDGGSRNHWIELALAGNSSNRQGIGSKVELKAGRLYQKREVYGGGGFLSQNQSAVHFGLGRHARVDMLRLLWPGGILQSELETPLNQRVEIRELDRKGTSCPILYVWNGRGYQFQTDFLGGSAYGYLLHPGEYNTPDTDEYIKLRRRDVALRQGRLALTMNNQLEEVILFDKVELVVVDHPGEYDVLPDEKLLPGPPYQGFRLVTVSHPRPPRTARDGRGRDLLESISRVDRSYAGGFPLLPFKGYAGMHELVLDLGQVDPRRVWLLMNAWIDYADSTSNLAASQAGVALVPPYLQVRDRQGKWVTVIERMGFPAGLPKTMTVDLSGRFLSSSREVRIVTNMRIYWDQILVESGPARRDYRLRRLPLERARLGFRGFPRFVSPDGREPKVYRYQQSSPTAQWKVHIGAYTRFGDVRSLLTRRDDMFVITRSGDQVEVFFDLRPLPALAPGWQRDYFLYVDGYGKDMDPNSARPDTVGPLPFHAMTSYPYPPSEHYPRGEAYRRYLEQYNTRLEERWTRDLARPRP